MIQSGNSRRQFLKASSACTLPLIVPATVLGKNYRAPSDRLNVGLIGLGGRGMHILGTLLANDEVFVSAICDVQHSHFRDRPWKKGPLLGREGGRRLIAKHYGEKAIKSTFVTDDFRKVCQRKELDIVVVATPDHWHALCALTAIQNGKDVYCEKPITHTFAEGKILRDAVEKEAAVFQTGSQQRSDPLFRKAVELVHNGHIGTVQKIEVGLPPGYSSPQGDSKITDPPENLNYDFWCGPAPKLPYMRARHHRWWRGHRAYGGGVLMDWIGHHNDIAHWGIEADHSGPTKVEAVGWQFPETEVYNTPASYRIECEYKGGIQTTISSQNPIGTKWIGDDGWVYVRRGSLKASDERWLEKDFDLGEKKVFASPGHMEDFLGCVKSRKSCIATAEIAHRSISPGFLGYVSHALQRPLEWDPEKEKVIGDSAANNLLNENAYRQPWSLTIS